MAKRQTKKETQAEILPPEEEKKNLPAVRNRDGVDLMKLDESFSEFFASGVEDDFENPQEEDLTVPRCNLTNFTSALVQTPAAEGGCEAGLWISNVDNFLFTEKPGEPIEIIPIYYFKGRILFPPAGGGKKGFQCKSEDFKTGRGNPGGSCAKCPMKEWPEEGSEKKKPDCQETHNFVCFLPRYDESRRVHVISFRSKGAPAGRQLFQLTIGSSGKRRIFGAAFLVGSRLEVNGTRKYYVPELRKWEGLNRFDHVIERYVKDLCSSPEEARAFLSEILGCHDTVKTLRRSGKFAIAETEEDLRDDEEPEEFEGSEENLDEVDWDEM